MRGLIRFLARLYPQRWRIRYGPEFDALLEEAHPSARTAFDVLTGAFAMQIRTWSFGRIFGLAALTGVLAVAGLVFTAPKRYVSTSVAKAETSPEAADELAGRATDLESNAALVSLIQRLDLYRAERTREPMEDVIVGMRKDLSILPITRVGDGKVAAVAIQFTYSDPRLAQTVTEELTSRLQLPVLDPASLPDRPLNPLLRLKDLDERTVGLAVLVAILVGTILACIFGGRSGRMQAACAWTCAAIVYGVSWLVPNTYLSTGVLKVSAPADVPRLVEQVLSSERLSSMIDQLRLYPDQRAKLPVEEIASRMREHVGISPIRSTRGSLVAVSVQFQYSDRKLAQWVTQELLGQMVNESVRTLHVLDPASLPEHVLGPRRDLIWLAAFAGGWALGGIIAFFRRRPAPAAPVLAPAS